MSIIYLVLNTFSIGRLTLRMGDYAQNERVHTAHEEDDDVWPGYFGKNVSGEEVPYRAGC